MSMGIVPSIVLTLTTRGQPNEPMFIKAAESILPGVLLGFWLLLLLTSAGEFSVFFKPAEIDFLFPAPYHRRQLLIYKLSQMARGLVLMALLCSIYFLPGLRSWISGFVGFFLTLVFMNLAGMILTLVGQIVSAHSFSTTRRVIGGGAVILLAAALAQSMAGGVADRNPMELVQAFRVSVAGRVLLAPFEVFSRTICAGGILDGLLTWGSAAAAIDLVLLALVFRLDADYLESAATVSGKIYERVLRSKQGGGIAMAASSSSIRIRPRQFPWLGGVGPVAWRQVILSLRRSRLQFLIALMMSIFFFFMTKSQLVRPLGVMSDATAYTLALIGGLLYMSFLMSMQAHWAFRGDLDHIEGLKTLPIRPTPLVLGELSGGVLILTAIQASILLISLVVVPTGPGLVFAALAFAVPMNTALLGVNNLLFLIYPVRMSSGTSMDFQEVGRAMIFMIIQVLILIPTFGIPGGLAGISYLAGLPVWACGIAAWAAFMAELPFILWLIGRAFDQFDPGTQIPA
jgi:hypothetical protein